MDKPDYREAGSNAVRGTQGATRRPAVLHDCQRRCGRRIAGLDQVCRDCAAEEARVRAHYAENPVPVGKLPRRRCRLGCHRRTDTHPDKMYEIRPGQYMCSHDIALVVQQAALMWPYVVTHTAELQWMLSQ